MIKRLTAGLTIIGLLVGLPLVLIALNAGPFDLPSWETIRAALTRPDDGTVLLGILKAAGWIVWAALAVSIAVEIVARLRGVTAPRMPGMGLPQKLARGLVGAVALTALAAPVAANAAPAAAPVAAVAVQTPTLQTPASAPAAAAPAVTATAVKAPAAKGAAETPSISHTVARGETLWGLAERYLGAGTRFREIVDLNPDTLSGHGDFLRPGWTLRIPAPPASYTVKAGDTLTAVAARFLGDPDRAEEILTASRDTDQSDGQRLTDPDLIRPGWILTLPNPTTPAGKADPAPSTTTSHREAPAPVKQAQAVDPEPAAAPAAPPPAPVPSAPSSPASAPAPSSSAPATQHPPATAEADDDTPWAPLLPVGVGTVLAAGVVTVLNRRRRDQQRSRRPGQRLPAPAAPDQQLERALRAGENPLDDVAAALRGLAVHFHGATLPTVRAGRVTPTHLDLYLETPATLPQPWVSAGDDTVWTIPLTDIQPLEDPAAEDTASAAPWPTLVTIGRDDEDGYVLLDLETLAALTVTPGTHGTRAVEILTALAVDLATSRWADDLRVTIVGACADLEDALQTGRIRYVPTAARVLDELEQRAGADQAALAASGMSSLQQARAHGLAPDAWVPDILITTTPLTDTQQQRLTRLLQASPRTAIAAVTLQTLVSEWSLDLDATDPTLAVLQPIGLRIRPQYLPRASYQALLKVADLTHPAEVVTVEEQVPDEPTLSTVPATPAALLPITTSGGNSPAGLPTIHPLADIDDAPDDVDDATPAPTPEFVDETPVVDGPPPGAADQPTAPVDDVDEGEGLGPVVISVLGPITLTGARGTCEPARRARLTEFAVYLALHPGVSHTDIDDAIWPNRKTEDNTATRHPVSTRLRNWLGLADDGLEFFPRHQGDDVGYVLHGVRTDVEQWDALIQGRPLAASTENLAAALALVRGRPFTGQRIRYYAWADPIKQRLIAEIVDASYDLGRRYYMAGDYPGCEKALTIGLDIDPGQERLHRLRILARHDAHDITGQQEAIDRLMVIADELDCELEPETEDLLADLSDPARLDDARTAI